MGSAALRPIWINKLATYQQWTQWTPMTKNAPNTKNNIDDNTDNNNTRNYHNNNSNTNYLILRIFLYGPQKDVNPSKRPDSWCSAHHAILVIHRNTCSAALPPLARVHSVCSECSVRVLLWINKQEFWHPSEFTNGPLWSHCTLWCPQCQFTSTPDI